MMLQEDVFTDQGKLFYSNKQLETGVVGLNGLF